MTAEAGLYRRHARFVTTEPVQHASEKEAALKALPRRTRREESEALEAEWRRTEEKARAEGEAALSAHRQAAARLRSALEEVAALQLRALLGRVEEELETVRLAEAHLDSALAALARGDFGAAGVEAEATGAALEAVGREVVLPLNELLGSAVISRELRAALEANLEERRAAKAALAAGRQASLPPTELVPLQARVHALSADGYEMAASVLSQQVAASTTGARSARVGQGDVAIVPPGECETFEDVGGLADVKARLRASVGALVERPDAAARYRVVHNGILFHGPPGVGKTLLSRALAGEYGLRYIRVTPTSLASSYAHESAQNVRRVFNLARDSAPCLLFLDEIDALAAERTAQTGGERREILTELLACLEEFRNTPGLVIAAATNTLDSLDQGLREGRFDTRIPIAMPDGPARAEILTIHLHERDSAVDWDAVDLDQLAGATAGCSGATLAAVVTLAAQYALGDDTRITTAHLSRAVQERGGRESALVEEALGWDDVVLADDVRAGLQEILNVFLNPELARRLGVRPPAGILLHGPPGTGKTTTALAMAARAQTSFYQLSASELVSKYVGESEQRVARLFQRARAHRPSIIFIDEVDALLRQRGADAAQSWEERLTSQFSQELDHLRSAEGVLLIGATSRVEIVDEAAARRLISIEIGLPDAVMRVRLLQLLCRDVRLDEGVNLRSLASATGGMSGADLRRLRDAAGMKALSRVTATETADPEEAAITMADFRAALLGLRARESLAVI